MTFSIQKKSAVSEYYDTTDPFIDDSELAIDQRQFFAQTKQQGFYVSSGEVALLKDKYVQNALHTFPDLYLIYSQIELPRNLNPRRFHLYLVFRSLSTKRRMHPSHYYQMNIRAKNENGRIAHRMVVRGRRSLTRFVDFYVVFLTGFKSPLCRQCSIQSCRSPSKASRNS